MCNIGSRTTEPRCNMVSRKVYYALGFEESWGFHAAGFGPTEITQDISLDYARQEGSKIRYTEALK